MKKNTSGPRFKALLEAANITTTGFAEFLDTAPQNVHNWYTRGVPAHCMEEVARKLSVNSEWLKTGEGPKDARHLRLVDDTGHTFDAQAIRGIYTVIEPTDIELPFYKETSITPRLQQNPRHRRPRTNPSACPAAISTPWKSTTPTPSAPP